MSDEAERIRREFESSLLVPLGSLNKLLAEADQFLKEADMELDQCVAKFTRFEKWLHARSGSKYQIPFWRTRRHWSGPLSELSRWPDIRLYNRLLDRVSKYTLCKLNRHDWDLNYMGPGCAGYSCIRCGLTKNVGNDRS